MGIPGKLAIAGIVGLVIGLGASFAAPRSYASQAILSVEGPPTAQARADLIDSLAERAWSRGVLYRMIESLDLYPASANASPQDLTTKMRQAISAKPADSGNTRFTVRFEYGDPHLAHQVVVELLRGLMEENDRGAQLGIPGANLTAVSPPTLPNSPVRSLHWVLLVEGLAGGLIVGALLSFRKPRMA